MYGADVEQLISGADGVKEAIMQAIISLAGVSNYAINSLEYHGGISTSRCTPVEVSVPASIGGGVSDSISAMGSQMSRLDGLSSNMYTSAGSFTNSIGSPWKEINQLKTAVNAVSSYGTLNYVGSKAGMLALLNMALTCAIDAKQAITTYQDWVQRGMDHMYNGNTPSITHVNTVEGDRSMGMVKQDYSDNVNIPQKSIDPF